MREAFDEDSELFGRGIWLAVLGFGEKEAKDLDVSGV
jgi:hypothetical protein